MEITPAKGRWMYWGNGKRQGSTDIDFYLKGKELLALYRTNAEGSRKEWKDVPVNITSAGALAFDVRPSKKSNGDVNLALNKDCGLSGTGTIYNNVEMTIKY